MSLREPFPSVLIAFLSLCLCFTSLSSLPLFDTDEPRYAETARVMLESGDWIVPSFNGQPRFAKPVLQYWLIASAFRLFGVSEKTARLPSALSGLALACFLAFWLYQVCGFRTALLAALCLIISPGYQLFAHAALTDMTLTFFMTVAVVSFWKVLIDPEVKVTGFIVGGVALGLASLTKGPTGFLLPLLVVITAALLSCGTGQVVNRLRTIKRNLLVSFAVFLITALPWYLAVSFRTAGDFSKEFFWEENVARFARGWSSLPFLVHILYYPIILFLSAVPWSVAAAAEMVCRERRDRESKNVRLLLTVWALLPIILFTFSKTKNPQYALLSLPALAGLAGLWFSQARPVPRTLMALTAAVLWMLCLAIGLVPLALNLYLPWRIRWVADGSVNLGWGLWIIVLALSVGGFVSLQSRNRSHLFYRLSVVGLFSLFLSLTTVAPRVADYRQEPIRWWAQAATALVGSEGVLAIYRRDVSSAVFYSRRRVLRVDDAGTLARLAASPLRLHLLVKKREAPELLRAIRLYPIGEKGLYLWLTNSIPVRARSAAKGRDE